MNNIDRKISEALRSADADIFADVGGELSIHEQVFDVFRGRAKWLAMFAVVVTIAVFVVAILMAIQFFRAEETRDLIAYATGFIFCMTAVGAMKVWYWMEMQKNAITREVKRLELQIARLAGMLGKERT